MKVNPRETANRVIAKRVTAPETRLDEASGKRVAMLSFIDTGSYQKHVPATKDLFVYAAGTNEEGEIPDGLDRLMHHRFVVHLNEDEKAIGLDIIPNRMYRSGVVPVSQEGVKNITVQYDLGGAVARVIKWPPNTRFEQTFAVLQELDKLIRAGKPITTSMRLGQIGRVSGTTDNTVEVRLNASRRRVQGEPSDDIEDVHEDVGEVEAPEEVVPSTIPE